MQLSDIGSIAYKLWYEIPEHFPNITLDEFIIMPDHIHGIIIINRNLKNGDMGSLHGDVGSLHDDVGSLHGDVDSLHGDVDDVGSLHATNLPTPDDASGKNETMSCISPKPGSLSVVIRSYKSVVTKNARLINSDFSWQSRFYDSIICTPGQLSRIRKYIRNNPMNWG